MKKPFLILFGSFLVLCLFMGCGKKAEPVVPPTTAATAPTMPETMPTRSPVIGGSLPTEETVSPTIEDGNGPIASQQITEATK